ncbi:MAG: TonB-dependent receptor [Bacteroidales bacterium]
MLGKGRVLKLDGKILFKPALMLFLLMLANSPGTGQELPEWRMDSVRSGVKKLLDRYQLVHNQLNANTDPEVERDFISLFSNPKVLIVNDIEEVSPLVGISAQDYLALLPALYPDGLALTFHTDRMLVTRPRYDFNNRYLVKAWVEKSLIGISRGKALSTRERVIVTIGFNLSDGRMTDWEIWGISSPPKGQSFLAVDLAPMLTGLTNRELAKDERFIMQNGFGYRAGARFLHQFNSHWGLQAGARYAHYRSTLVLDRIDPLDGFDPHLEQVHFDTRLWYAEMTVGPVYRADLGRRLHLLVGAGIAPGLRLFESSATLAVNSNGRGVLNGVVSDVDWIDGMGRFSLTLFSQATLAWSLKKNVSLTAGLEYDHGLTRLGEVKQPDYLQTRYLGQYNPIWRSPGARTLSHSFGITIGTLIRIEPKKE